jgi:hypothetical protein
MDSGLRKELSTQNEAKTNEKRIDRHSKGKTSKY